MGLTVNFQFFEILCKVCDFCLSSLKFMNFTYTDEEKIVYLIIFKLSSVVSLYSRHSSAVPFYSVGDSSQGSS